MSHCRLVESQWCIGQDCASIVILWLALLTGNRNISTRPAPHCDLATETIRIPDFCIPKPPGNLGCNGQAQHQNHILHPLYPEYSSIWLRTSRPFGYQPASGGDRISRPADHRRLTGDRDPEGRSQSGRYNGLAKGARLRPQDPFNTNGLSRSAPSAPTISHGSSLSCGRTSVYASTYLFQDQGWF